MDFNLTSNKPNFAVFGNPISHSLSPLIHQLFAKELNMQLSYKKIPVPMEEFEEYVMQFFQQGGKGLNITVPFKVRAFQLAEIHSPSAAEAGAANTLWVQNGILHADNTDGVGLVRDLKKHIELAHQSILLLGAGGAARSVIHSLLHANIATLTLYNRTFSKAEEIQRDFPKIHIAALEDLKENYDIIINATSSDLGGSDFTLPSNITTNFPFCYDLMYNLNHETSFVHWANDHLCQSVDGVGMLIEQAAESFFIWNHQRPRTAEIKELLLAEVNLQK